jgi:hypothetical protein
MDVHHMIVLAETMNARLMHNEDGPKVSRALYEALFRAEAFNLDEVPYTPTRLSKFYAPRAFLRSAEPCLCTCVVVASQTQIPTQYACLEAEDCADPCHVLSKFKDGGLIRDELT